MLWKIKKKKVKIIQFDTRMGVNDVIRRNRQVDPIRTLQYICIFFFFFKGKQLFLLRGGRMFTIFVAPVLEKDTQPN